MRLWNKVGNYRYLTISPHHTKHNRQQVDALFNLFNIHPCLPKPTEMYNNYVKTKNIIKPRYLKTFSAYQIWYRIVYMYVWYVLIFREGSPILVIRPLAANTRGWCSITWAAIPTESLPTVPTRYISVSTTLWHVSWLWNGYFYMFAKDRKWEWFCYSLFRRTYRPQVLFRCLLIKVTYKIRCLLIKYSLSINEILSSPSS